MGNVDSGEPKRPEILKPSSFGDASEESEKQRDVLQLVVKELKLSESRS